MNKNKEKKHEEKRYDLIVIFKEEKYTDIRNKDKSHAAVYNAICHYQQNQVYCQKDRRSVYAEQ